MEVDFLGGARKRKSSLADRLIKGDLNLDPFSLFLLKKKKQQLKPQNQQCLQFATDQLSDVKRVERLAAWLVAAQATGSAERATAETAAGAAAAGGAGGGGEAAAGAAGASGAAAPLGKAKAAAASGGGGGGGGGGVKAGGGKGGGKGGKGRARG